jgi:hypothetical protein
LLGTPAERAGANKGPGILGILVPIRGTTEGVGTDDFVTAASLKIDPPVKARHENG